MNVPNSVLWWPSGRNDKLISIDEENIFLWSLDCSRKSAQVWTVNEIFGIVMFLVFVFMMCGI